MSQVPSQRNVFKQCEFLFLKERINNYKNGTYLSSVTEEDMKLKQHYNNNNN